MQGIGQENNNKRTLVRTRFSFVPIALLLCMLSPRLCSMNEKILYPWQMLKKSTLPYRHLLSMAKIKQLIHQTRGTGERDIFILMQITQIAFSIDNNQPYHRDDERLHFGNQ